MDNLTVEIVNNLLEFRHLEGCDAVKDYAAVPGVGDVLVIHINLLLDPVNTHQGLIHHDEMTGSCSVLAMSRPAVD